MSRGKRQKGDERACIPKQYSIKGVCTPCTYLHPIVRDLWLVGVKRVRCYPLCLGVHVLNLAAYVVECDGGHGGCDKHILALPVWPKLGVCSWRGRCPEPCLKQTWATSCTEAAVQNKMLSVLLLMRVPMGVPTQVLHVKVGALLGRCRCQAGHCCGGQALWWQINQHSYPL